jgi:hypothetical protein
MADAARRRCQATTQGGERCGAKPVAGQEYCPWHTDDPSWVARRLEWSRRGGAGKAGVARARRRLQPAMTAAELERLVGQVLRDVVKGEVEPGVGNCVANLGRALASIRETVTIEERLTELERAAGIGEGRSA